MPRRLANNRRRGHRETPSIVAMVWLICTFGMGAMTIVRDTKRAEKIGATLDNGEKWTAFWHGCLGGTALFFIFVVTICVIIAIGLWLEKWRWKRQDARNKEKP